MPSFFGLPIGSIYTLINQNFVLDKTNGSVHKVEKVLEPILRASATPAPSTPSTSNTPPPPPPPPPIQVLAQPPQVIQIKKEVEVVTGVDRKAIDLSLVSSEGALQSNGFLVEVYLSGTDGKLTRVYRQDIVDVLSDDVLQEGFGHYLILEVDR